MEKEGIATISIGQPLNHWQGIDTMYRERPFFIPFLALASGLAVADLFPFSISFFPVAALLSCLLLASLIHNRLPHMACTFLFFFVFGLYALTPWKLAVVAPDGIQSFAGRDQVSVEGVIAQRPVEAVDTCTIVLDVDTVERNGTVFRTGGKLQVSIASGEVGAARGDRVRCNTRISVPHVLGLPGEFDYRRHLIFRGIAATAWIKSADELLLIHGGERESLLRSIDLHARRLGEQIRQAVEQPERSSVLMALLLGNQKRIPEELSRAYTRAGVNHILSVSGFHVGVIAFFIVQFALLSASRSEYLLLGLNLRRSVLFLSLPAMIAYLLLTGAAPATARSVVMMGIFVLALCSERETDPLNVLLMAAMLLVSIEPPVLFDPSFQLSFLALWGIIVIAPQVMRLFSEIERPGLRKLLQFIAVSIAASLVTALPVLFLFGQASLNGIFANLLIVPLLGYGAVLTGFTALVLLHIFTPAGVLLLGIAGELTGFSNRLVIWFGELPTLTYFGITRWDMLFFLTGLAIITFGRKRTIKVAALIVLPAMAVVLHLRPSPLADGRLHLTMLSVGQGESIVMHLPDGGIMLLDGGGYLHETGKNFGERILAPALLAMGVRRIDQMVMSHSHPDHAGGLPFVVEKFPVGEFLEPAFGGSGARYEQLQTLLLAKGVPVRRLHAGEKLEPSPGVVLTVLSPSLESAPLHEASEENEESLVLHLRYGKASALLTADSGFTTEERIMRSGVDISAGLLKVGHHGSRYSTSEAFLNLVKPDIALISAGRDNVFGLPSPRTLTLLQGKGIKVYRTDLDGTIVMSTDGSKWSCTSLYNAD